MTLRSFCERCAVRTVAVTVLTAFVAVAATVARAEAPKSVTVETRVIMASKGEVAKVDNGLDEVADLLKKMYGRMFNRFRLHQTVSGDVELKKDRTFSLVDNYHLKVGYRGATVDAETGEAKKVELSVLVVRRVPVRDGGGKTYRDEPVGAALTYTLPRGYFVLIGGPKVDNQHVILAIRVTKT